MTPLTKYYDQLRIYESHLKALDDQYQFFKKNGLSKDMKRVVLLKKEIRICRKNFINVSERIYEISDGKDLSLICRF